MSAQCVQCKKVRWNDLLLDVNGDVWCKPCAEKEITKLRAQLATATRQRDELLDAMEQGPFKYWGVPEKIRGEINDEGGEG